MNYAKHRIIVSDVFGRTPALEKICDNISKTTEIFDPYDGEYINFEGEKEAYDYFIHNVGLEEYTENLVRYLARLDRPTSLVGFSVGASAIWIASEKMINTIAGAVCFYGSQIRNYRYINPKFPIKLIFPCIENHFSISELVFDLSEKENVLTHVSDYYHGFMNLHSKNFNGTAYISYLSELKNSAY